MHQERVQRLKYSVSTDEKLASSTPHDDRKFERQRLKYERLTKVCFLLWSERAVLWICVGPSCTWFRLLAQVLVSVKAGIQHLSERLEGVKLDDAPLV